MKKTCTLFAILTVFALIVTACTTPAGTETEMEETVEIDFWNPFTGDAAAVVDRIIADYNASQDRIVVTSLSNQDPQKQLTAISGGNAPDLVITYWNNVGPWSEAGAVLNLESLVASSGFDTAAIIPAALDRMKVDGELHGFPISMSMANKLFYNKQTFADAGLAEPPETLEQLFEYAKQLTKKDAGGNMTQIGFIPDYPWIDNVFWPIIFGGSWDDGNGKLTANQQANVDAIAYQAKFYEEFGVDTINKFKSGMGQMNTPQDPIITGTMAMMIGWENWYNDQRGEEGVIGVAPFPYPEGRPELKNSGMVSPVAMFIPAKSSHPDEAWEVMQYLLSEEAQIRYAAENKTIPVLLSALDNPALTENEELASLWEFFESAKSPNLNGFPNSIYINEYLQALNEETEKAIKGQISAQEAMDQVVARMQPIADQAKE